MKEIIDLWENKDKSLMINRLFSVCFSFPCGACLLIYVKNSAMRHVKISQSCEHFVVPDHIIISPQGKGKVAVSILLTNQKKLTITI